MLDTESGELISDNYCDYFKLGFNRDYIQRENEAYDNLVSKGYTPQGADKDFKSVCVMKFEHPEFWQNPVKRGKREVFHFKNWQEADAKLN